MKKNLSAAKSWFTKTSWPIRIIILLAVIAVGWFSYTKVMRPASSQPQYQTAQVEKGTLIIAVAASGQVSTVNSISVNTAASGVVSQVFVSDGEKVKAGTPLAKLDLDQTSKQKYFSALASYESAKANLHSLQNTLFVTNQKLINDAVARNLASDDPTYIEENATWLAAEASYKNQQNSINATALALQQASPVIVAPISGTVTGLSLQKGSGLTSSTSSTTTGQKIASIKTEANPAISVNLTEIDVPKVKVGQKATVIFDALTDKTFTGKVASIDTVGTVASGVVSYPAVVTLDTSSPAILPNMSATVNIVLDTRTDVLLVPSIAVETQNGQSTVRVMKGKQIQTISVAIGLSSDSQTEIGSGLDGGETVITGTVVPTAASRGNQTQSPFGAFRIGGVGGGGGGGGARFNH